MNDLHSTEFFEERAAIREFCAGMSRPNAERLARVDVLAMEARAIDARRKWQRVINHDGGRN